MYIQLAFASRPQSSCLQCPWCSGLPGPCALGARASLVSVPTVPVVLGPLWAPLFCIRLKSYTPGQSAIPSHCLGQLIASLQAVPYVLHSEWQNTLLFKSFNCTNSNKRPVILLPRDTNIWLSLAQRVQFALPAFYAFNSTRDSDLGNPVSHGYFTILKNYFQVNVCIKLYLLLTKYDMRT